MPSSALSCPLVSVHSAEHSLRCLDKDISAFYEHTWLPDPEHSCACLPGLCSLHLKIFVWWPTQLLRYLQSMTRAMGTSVTVSLGSDLKSTTSMYSVYLRLIFKPTDRASCSTVVSRACASVWSRESKAVSSASVCDGVPTCGLIVSHECCLVWHVLKCIQLPASMVPECLLVVPRHWMGLPLHHCNRMPLPHCTASMGCNRQPVCC